MTAIAKSAKRHPAAKKCCGWEEPAIYVGSKTSLCRLYKPSLHYTFFSHSLVNTSAAILVPTNKILLKKKMCLPNCLG